MATEAGRFHDDYFHQRSHTMTVTHVGSTKKYAAGWESIFGGKKSSRVATPTQAAGKRASIKKTAAKKKKGAGKKR
jgi:hypothetical protein